VPEVLLGRASYLRLKELGATHLIDAARRNLGQI
jgi:hypothetical protein